MKKHTIERFVSYANLQTDGLLRRDCFAGADIYDDYAVLEFRLPEPKHIDELLDIVEDQDDLVLLYHVTPSKATITGQQFCAYAMLNHDYTHKLNAVADDDGIITAIAVTLYDSLERMGFDLLDELERRTSKGSVIHYSRSEAELLRDFMS